MSLRPESLIEYAGDLARALEDSTITVAVKNAVVEKCEAAYSEAEGFELYPYDEARPQVYAAVNLLDEALRMLPETEEASTEVRSLRRSLAKAQDTLEDALFALENA